MARWNPFGKSDKTPSEESAPTAASDSANTDADSNDAQPAAQEPKKTGFFGGIKQALKKTVRVLNTDIRDLVKEEGRLVDDQFLEELFAHLIKTDMGVGPAGKIRDDIHSKFRARKLFMSDLIGSAKVTIREIMEQDDAGMKMADSGPTVIMVVGVNGAGKTTSIAKLANLFSSQAVSYTHLTLPTIYSV